MQKVDPPAQVIDAFRDVQAARANLEQFAERSTDLRQQGRTGRRAAAHRRSFRPAEGYKEQAVAEAKGQSSRFLKVYEEYKKAPDVTRETNLSGDHGGACSVAPRS